MTTSKPYRISKQVVWEAYQQVKANQGAAGVDGESIATFEQNLKGNLYKIWNRMSSGSYLPPPVRAVEIPKPHGGGVRMLGVPTIADRVAQTVVAMFLEPLVEPMFHPDSYGYRPNKSAHDALTGCRQRCWKFDWAIDLDVQKFFDANGSDWPVLAVDEGRIALDYGVSGVPESFLVDPAGYVRAKITGGVTSLGLDRILARLEGNG